ncbi:MAG: radical SAM protein [Ruminococcaceae bacterium]|nr:radical SAM protein [Oscillospiraceae bacterium]
MYSRVYLEITNICNKNCSFCHKTKREPKSLTLSEFDLITDKLIGITEYLYLHLMGEPLIHPLISDFVELATKKGFKVAITTNGTLLNKVGDKLLSAGLYKLNISLHSFEDEDKNAYDKYINNCIEFADKSSKVGVLTVFRLWNNGFDGGRNDDILSILQSKLSGEWQQGSRGYRIRNKLHLEYGDRFTWPDINAPFISDNVFCYGLRDHFGILSDGTVVPCCLDSDGIVKLGNVFESSLKEILNTPRAKAIFDGFTSRTPSEELCKRCGYAQRFK